MPISPSYIFYETTSYPGEVFLLPLAVVGFDFGLVTGPVYANLLPRANNSNSSLHAYGEVDYHGCTHLEFTVNSLNPMETIVLTINDTIITKVAKPSDISYLINLFQKNHVIPFPLLVVPVYIDVTLLDCPSGFELTESGRCNCISALKEIGINNCSIYMNKPQVTRSGNQWIQLLNNSDSILTSRFCPFNYCKQETIILDLNDPDQQCALGHTGILCGACPSNLSLAIGSSRCLECSDDYHMLLLIAFAAAGVLLVMIIKILDLTVTTGTINGLVFYANIIWANQSVLLPSPLETSYLLRFLKTFIAWLNLDLGIETCFIQHLDGYWKTWLQFTFPAYIWLLAGLIILVAHYSTRATKYLEITLCQYYQPSFFFRMPSYYGQLLLFLISQFLWNIPTVKKLLNGLSMVIFHILV